MAPVHIGPDDPVYLSPIGPTRFGEDNWGKVNRFDQVLEGDPIGQGEPFEDSDIFHSFRMVFVEGARWTDTPFYRGCARQIRKGRPLWNCTTPEALLRRLEDDIGTLYRSMKAHGFLSQRRIAEMVRPDRPDDGAPAAAQALVAPFARPGYPSTISHKHEVKLGLNEAGGLLFLDGRHRFAIARLLGLAAIPCRVVFRHHSWAGLRDTLAGAAAAAAQGPRDMVPAHPDLAHLRLSAAQAAAVRPQLAARGAALPALHRHAAPGPDGAGRAGATLTGAGQGPKDRRDAAGPGGPAGRTG